MRGSKQAKINRLQRRLNSGMSRMIRARHRKLAALLKMGKNRVKRVMKKYGIAARRKKKRYVYPGKASSIVPNVLRDPQTPADQEVMFSDIFAHSAG